MERERSHIQQIHSQHRPRFSGHNCCVCFPRRVRLVFGYDPSVTFTEIFFSRIRRIQILGLECDVSGSNIIFKPIASVETIDNPMTLHGELLLYSDHSAKTIVLNWKTLTWAALSHLPDGDQGVNQVTTFSSLL
jgi:hypothetical protein